MRLPTEKYRLLSLLAVLLVAGFTATSLAGYLSSREAIRRGIQEQALPLTGDNIYSEIQRDLLQPVFISSLMANDTFVRDWMLGGERDSQRIVRYLREVKHKYGAITAFLVSDRTHAYYYPNGELKTIQEHEPRDAWFFRVRSMGDPYEINVDPDMANRDTMTVFINYRLLDYQEHFLGAVGVGLTLDAMGKRIDAYEERFRRRIYFTDPHGVVVLAGKAMTAQRGSIRDMPGIRDIAPQILTYQATPTSLQYVRNGHTILVNSRYIPELAWYLVVEQDEETELAPAEHMLAANLAISAGVTLLVLLLMLLAANRYQRKLESMAMTDSLTGLLNRQAFDLAQAPALAGSLRNGLPVSAILFDLDLFKSVNDTLGHLAGDEVLRTLARLVRDNIRDADIVARWGGEEFLILLPGCDAKRAAEVADKLRRTIAEHHFEVGNGAQAQISASMGVVQFAPPESSDEFFARADAALYEAKNGGRNRVVVNDQSTLST